MTESKKIFKLQPFKVTEHQRQIEIVQWLRANGFLVFCMDVMTALSKIPTQAARMAFIKHYKAMGYTKGQPDLVAIRDDLPPIFFEVKTDEGRLSPEQKDMMLKLCNSPYYLYYIVRNWTDLPRMIGELRRPLPDYDYDAFCDLETAELPRKKIVKPPKPMLLQFDFMKEEE